MTETIHAAGIEDDGIIEKCEEDDNMINREDMLELTRRMTPARNCFARIAGAYMDEEGYDHSTFNLNFRRLSTSETRRNLEMAKTIPFAETNVQLKEYRFPEGEARRKSMWPLLSAMKQDEMKDDALLSVFYELMGENYRTNRQYCIFMFYGSYDVPVHGTDGAWLEGSEEVYDFLICAVAPTNEEYEPGKPEFGFLFPAFKDRSGDSEWIDFFQADSDEDQTKVIRKILGEPV